MQTKQWSTRTCFCPLFLMTKQNNWLSRVYVANQRARKTLSTVCYILMTYIYESSLNLILNLNDENVLFCFFPFVRWLILITFRTSGLRHLLDFQIYKNCKLFLELRKEKSASSTNPLQD